MLERGFINTLACESETAPRCQDSFTRRADCLWRLMIFMMSLEHDFSLEIQLCLDSCVQVHDFTMAWHMISAKSSKGFGSNFDMIVMLDNGEA